MRINSLFFALCLVSACALLGCSKPTPSTTTASSTMPTNAATGATDDPVQKRLQELAGSNQINCGILKSQVPAELDAAGKCAMAAAKARTPFSVEYQMPGMNVALADNAQGKLYSVQSQEGGAGMVSTDCPAELRMAPSGRVTCYAPGTFPMSAGAGSHTSLAIPPMMERSAGSPHGNKGDLPPGHPKPQQP